MGEWKRVKIGDVCTVKKGVTGLAKALPGDYPLVTTGAERKTSREYQFDTKAVCIPLVSSTGHGKKTLNYVHYQEGKFALGSILSAVVPRDETILDARYLHVYLQKNKDRFLVPLMRGAANVSLSTTAISNIEVPLPSLIEQKKILDKIDSISNEHEDFLNELNVQIDLFGKLRQAVLQEAIEGKLTAKWREHHPGLISGNNHASKLLEKIKAEKERLIKEGKIKKDKPLAPITDAEKPFDLPAGWVWCRWIDLLSFEKYSMKRGPFGSTLRKNYFVKKGIRVFEQYNAINDDPHWVRYYITEEKFKELKSFSAGPGDLLISCSGVTLGRITEIPDDAEIGIINQALLKLHLHKDLITNVYFKLLFRSIYMQKYIFGMAWGIAIPNMVGVNELKKILIPLPSFREQQAIVERVDKLMAMIDELEKQVSERKEQSEMLMQSVLREAFAR